MSTEGRKAASESITLRISKPVLDSVRKEADNKEISINTLANQIFAHHVEWNNNAAKAGLVAFPKPLLIKLMEGFTEKQVGELAANIARNHVKNIILLLRKEHSIETFLDVVESWVRASGFPFMHELDEELRMHSFVIQHELGKKWSVYLAELYRYVFEELGTEKATFEVTSTTVIFKIRSR
jgi:hypothetical protein